MNWNSETVLVYISKIESTYLLIKFFISTRSYITKQRNKESRIVIYDILLIYLTIKLF